MRVLGLRHRAEQEVVGLPPETRGMLEAYARGVNAWTARRMAAGASVEFLPCWAAPAPWTPVDSLLWGKTMGMYLSGNWDTELSRQSLSATVPRAKIDGAVAGRRTPRRASRALRWRNR